MSIILIATSSPLLFASPLKSPPIHKTSASLAIAVSGQVTSSQGTPLRGVSVTVKGTATGTSTDGRGAYSINVSGNGTLVFSFIGFITQEVSVSNQTTINVELQEELKELNEVVVTALGIKRQVKSLGYSTTEIPGSTLTESRTPNLA
ncbi:MAG TPA: carboxypeptidase-like regulatory domain-containing protein, partial [Chitinophagaceae bacterium]